MADGQNVCVSYISLNNRYKNYVVTVDIMIILEQQYFLALVGNLVRRQP